ncbi:MAG: glycosyltransferase family 4 protein [Sphaerochaetaceae bacterium]|nr:glycosyltransferase family 4 protein [Sphaerochaetaceae bacterium]
MKKKVILFHHSDNLGGAGVSLLNIYLMLEDEYDVKIYVPHDNSPIKKFYNEKDISTNIINDNIGMISSYSGGPKLFSRTYFVKLFQIIKTRKTIIDILNREKPDLFIINSMTLSWVGKIVQKRGIKSLCFVRETFVNNIGMKVILHHLNKFFDGVLFISNNDKNTFNCKAKTIGVVYNCVNKKNYIRTLSKSEACSLLGLNDKAFNILFVGGDSELKGWSIIKNAMRELEDYEIKLIVAGKASLSNYISVNINYIGEQLKMPIVYTACDLLVFPSTSPHQARPAFEAGIMGLPVIISDFKETHETISDGINGLTFEPCDSKALSLAILKLYKDRDLCNRLGQSNYKFCLENHEFDTCKVNLLTYLHKII